MTSTTSTETVEVKVGDFFVCSWGYDQTNIDFYKVVGLTPSGKSVKVQKWSSAAAGPQGGPQEKVVPGSTPATYNDWSEVPEGTDYWERQQYVQTKPVPVETKRLHKGGYKGASFTVNSYSAAYLWDGEPESQTGYGYGH